MVHCTNFLSFHGRMGTLVALVVRNEVLGARLYNVVAGLLSVGLSNPIRM